MIKRILAHLGLIELVWTKDGDGAVRLVKVYNTPFGRMVYGIGGRYVGRTGFLGCDGIIYNGSYMKKWKPYRSQKSEALIMDAIYGVREDGSVWVSIGNPKTGLNCQFDLCCTFDAKLICDTFAMVKTLEDALDLAIEGLVVNHASGYALAARNALRGVR